jgi:phosphate-selective porin OprO/OprP
MTLRILIVTIMRSVAENRLKPKRDGALKSRDRSSSERDLQADTRMKKFFLAAFIVAGVASVAATTANARQETPQPNEFQVSWFDEGLENPAEKKPQLATVDQIEQLQSQIDFLREQGPTIVLPPEEKTDSFPKINMTGVFQLDAAYFSQSEESIATLGDIEDGMGFRRARLAASVSMTDRVSMLMEFDFAQAQPRFVDVWGQISDTPFGNIRIGRYRQPFGMAELTSVRHLPFLERPTIFALAPFRQSGIMLFDNAFDEQATWAISGFRALSDNFGNVYGEDGGYGTAERVTALLIDHGDTGIVHVGVAHSYMQPGRNQLLYASQDEIFVGQQPNLGPSGLSVSPLVGVPPFVNTGVFNVDDVHLFNVEGAMSIGRGVIESEYRWANVHLPNGENATVHGGYAQARFMLSGETIAYNRGAGVFGDINPDNPLDIRSGGLGAFEIATRLSFLDLNPLAENVPGPGRRLTSTSVALNWYWWDNAKAQFEYVNGQLNDLTLGDSDSNTFASRVQFDF